MFVFPISTTTTGSLTFHSRYTAVKKEQIARECYGHNWSVVSHTNVHLETKKKNLNKTFVPTFFINLAMYL